jgi:malonyl-CoA O-methyltransferase
MNLSKNKIIQGFNKAAANYDQYAKLQRQVAEGLFVRIKPEITNDNLLLDAGSGTGYFHELLRKNKIYCPLIQADISFKMCERAAEYASPPEYGGTYTITADVENLPIADCQIDKVFSSLTLQWADFVEASNEIYRALKPTGTLAFSTIGAGSLEQLASAFAKMDNLPHINENFLGGWQIKEQLVQAGFKDILIAEEIITHYYSDIKILLHSIKGVGAAYKGGGRQYLGKNYFRELEEIYRAEFGGEQGEPGLPLTWKIIYGVGRKE